MTTEGGRRRQAGAKPTKKAAKKLPTKKAPVEERRGGWKIRDEKAIARGAKFLKAVYERANVEWMEQAKRQGRRPRHLTYDDIVYASRLPDGSGGISRGTISKLLNAEHGADVKSLRALARAFHGFTTFDELADAYGIIPSSADDDRSAVEKMRDVLVAESIPGHIIEEIVGHLEFRLGEGNQRKAL